MKTVFQSMDLKTGVTGYVSSWNPSLVSSTRTSSDFVEIDRRFFVHNSKYSNVVENSYKIFLFLLFF